MIRMYSSLVHGVKKGGNGGGLLEQVEEFGKVVYTVEYPIEYDLFGISLYALESHSSGLLCAFRL